MVPLTLHTAPLLKICSPGSKTCGGWSGSRCNLHKRLCDGINVNLMLARRTSHDAIG